VPRRTAADRARMPPTAWRDAEPREAIAPKGRARWCGEE
jgi:hypothetical protein